MKISLLVIYALFIGFMSLRQGDGPDVEHADKVMHFAAYGLFAVLGFIASKTKKVFFNMCVAIIAYGGLLEVAQFYTVGREMSVYDFIANSLGVLAGAWAATMAKSLGQKQLGSW